MKRGWIVASGLFLALFLFIIWQSWSLPFLDDLGPGPGFFPIWLAGLGTVLSVLLMIETARGPADPPDETLVPPRDAMFRIAAVVVLLSLAALSLEWLGWRITATAFVLLLLPALGARSPLAIVPVAAFAGFGVFHVFYYWLKVPLPIGTFGI